MTQPNLLISEQHRAQSGYSLIELMISIVIGLLLMVAILQIFLGSKNIYRTTDNHSRLQENGRYIIEEISRDIRMAGYHGCSKHSTIRNIAKPVASTWVRFNEPVHGYDTVPVTPDIGLAASEVLSGTDVIRVQRAEGSDARLTGNMATTNANIQINGNPDQFQDDDILIISDCAKTDIFRANNVSSGGGTVTISHAASVNTDVNLSKAYDEQAEIMRLSTAIYYIGSGSGGCPANMLCRKVLSGAVLVIEELIDNAQDMQLEYGEDTDADFTANRFVNATAITNWDNIVSVRVNLLLRSDDAHLTTSPQPYTFNSTTPTTPSDRRLRRVFSNTVTLRNRTL